MIPYTECLWISITNKSRRANQHAKPPFEGVYLAWRLNHAKKLTFDNRKVNQSGVSKTDRLLALNNLIDIWRDRAFAPRLKPEHPHTGRIRIGIKTMPFLTLTNQTRQD